MIEEHIVSRRANLKSLGTMGAAVVLRCVTPASPQGESKPAGSGQDKQPVNVPHLAVERMAKGHS